jgi:hypothetical protein
LKAPEGSIVAEAAYARYYEATADKDSRKAQVFKDAILIRRALALAKSGACASAEAVLAGIQGELAIAKTREAITAVCGNNRENK